MRGTRPCPLPVNEAGPMPCLADEARSFPDWPRGCLQRLFPPFSGPVPRCGRQWAKARDGTATGAVFAGSSQQDPADARRCSMPQFDVTTLDLVILIGYVLGTRVVLGWWLARKVRQQG